VTSSVLPLSSVATTGVPTLGPVCTLAAAVVIVKVVPWAQTGAALSPRTMATAA
jgi:hypothetical protein